MKKKTGVMKRMVKRWIYSVLLAVMIAASGASAASSAQFSLKDTAGKIHTEEEWQRSGAVVLFFITTDCPISNSYVPEMNRIAAAYSAQGVRFYAVVADTETSLEDIRKHAQEFGYAFPVLLDPHQVLVKLTKAEITPEAAVLSSSGQLRYLGRIDNRVTGFGKQRPRPTEHDLQEALDATLAGKPVARPSTTAIGCSIVHVN